MNATEQEIPTVCFLDDVARILRMSRRTIQKLRRHHAFPIRELPSVDKRPRWSADSVRRYLAGERASSPMMRLAKGQR
jgi:hypothetical protein